MTSPRAANHRLSVCGLDDALQLGAALCIEAMLIHNASIPKHEPQWMQHSIYIQEQHLQAGRVRLL
jgi:hypothetical protein